MYHGPMTLDEIVRHSGGQSAFARKLGVHRQELNRILRGRHKLGPSMAIRIYQQTGHKLGPLEENPRKP